MGAIHSTHHSYQEANKGTHHSNGDHNKVTQPEIIAKPHITHLIIQSLASFSDDSKPQLPLSSHSSSRLQSATIQTHNDIYHTLHHASKKSSNFSARLRPSLLYGTRQYRRENKSLSHVTLASKTNHSSVRLHPSSEMDVVPFKTDDPSSNNECLKQPIRRIPKTYFDLSAKESDKSPSKKSYLQRSDNNKSSKTIPVVRKLHKNNHQSYDDNDDGSNQRHHHRHSEYSGHDSTSTSATSILDDYKEEEKYLKRMYDLRTWDMYIRITEARKCKKKHTQSHHHIMGPQTSDIPRNTSNDHRCEVQQQQQHQQHGNDQQPGNDQHHIIDHNGVMPLQQCNISYQNNQVVWLMQQNHCHPPQQHNHTLLQELNTNEHELIFGDIE
jgi:hypothetical protein